MILTRLYEHAQRLQDKLPIEGYGEVRLSWLVELNQDGTLKANGFTKLDKNDPRRKLPDRIRAAGIKPKLLADNGEYVFGVGRETSPPEKVAERHRQFKELVQQCADVTQNPSVQAVAKFLANWNPEQDKAKLPEDFNPSQTVTFSVEGKIPADAIPEMQAVQQFWVDYLKSGDGDSDSLPQMQCLVTGQDGLVEERLPVKIKGIPDGQTAGTSLVSANAAPFTSYGLSNSLTSPISREAGEGFAKALNYLIATEDSRLYVGPVVYVFWTQEPSEYDFFNDLGDDQPQEVKNLYTSALAGKRIYDEPNQFYALGLSASGGRAVVRDWIEMSIPEVMQNLVRWFEAQEIVNPFGQLGEKPYLSIRRLSNCLYRDAQKEAISNIPPLLMRSALKGTPLPLHLLTRVVRRICVDRSELHYPVTHSRAALIKLILTSQGYAMTNMQSLNRNPSFDNPQDHAAYHCGRLLAQLEIIQRKAQKKINATLVDRYYGAASTTPAKVMGKLVQDAQPHLSKIRKDDERTCNALQSHLEDIIDQLSPEADKFPRTLSMQQQSIFALGYYHQRADNKKAAIAGAKAKKNSPAKDTDQKQSDPEN